MSQDAMKGEEGTPAQKPAGTGTPSLEDRGVTLRAIVFGLCVAVAVNLLGNAVRYLLHASFMAYCHMPMGNLIVSLVAIIFCAPLGYYFGKRFVLSPTEWITVFSMGFISSLGPTYGISGYLVGIMVGPYYFNTPENQWDKYLTPYMPNWLIPTNDGNAVGMFYEGLPKGASIPWDIWAVPLFWWFTFLCAVGLACACASIIMRKQWSENERLVYPAMEPIIEMTTRAGSGRGWLPDFMSGKAFWVGFIITTFVFGWNMISWFYPQFPRFPTASPRWIFFSRDYPPGFFFLSTVVICFSYFASLEILFSIWFFDVLFILEGGILNRLGITAISPYYGTGRYSWQTAGGFVSFALWGLWISRNHLRQVWRKAIRPADPVIDDSREFLSYRGAMIGLLISCLYVAIWLGRAGMELKVIVVILPAMLLIYTTISKMLADSGLIYLNPPTSAWGITSTLYGGTHYFQHTTKAALGLSSLGINHYRGLTMSLMMHINRLAESVTGNKRKLFWGLCGAFAVGLVTSTLFTLWLGYSIGGYNFQPNWLIISAGRGSLGGIATSIKKSTPTEATNYWFFLVGAGVMGLLNLMRYRFVWWPFHPIGFALSGTALARLTSVTILVAWLLKLAMLKLAGAGFYRKSRPFFVGMLVGYILQVGIGLLVDAIWFQPQGHTVHKWY